MAAVHAHLRVVGMHSGFCCLAAWFNNNNNLYLLPLAIRITVILQ